MPPMTPKPKMHSRANIYLFERPNSAGLVECENCPYPLIPKVPAMKRAASVRHALANTVDDAYAFAIARSYMAEKFIRLKSLAAVHISVLQVEKEINPHYLQAFNDARVYFGLPSCYLYRDNAISRMVNLNGMAVTRLNYDEDGDTPPAYSQYALTAEVPIRPHCHSCTCTSHTIPVPASTTPPYEEREERDEHGESTSPRPSQSDSPSRTPSLDSRATSPSSSASAPLTPIPSPSLSAASMGAWPVGLAIAKQRRRSIAFWR